MNLLLTGTSTGIGRALAARLLARGHGLTFGRLPTGAANAITDVPGVRVGHVTIWHGEGDEPIARTGVTAIVPDSPIGLFHRPMPAG